jgi:hypothetical protein
LADRPRREDRCQGRPSRQRPRSARGDYPGRNRGERWQLRSTRRTTRESRAIGRAYSSSRFSVAPKGHEGRESPWFSLLSCSARCDRIPSLCSMWG